MLDPEATVKMYHDVKAVLEKYSIDPDSCIVVGISHDEHFNYVMSTLPRDFNRLSQMDRSLLGSKLREIAEEIESFR